MALTPEQIREFEDALVAFYEFKEESKIMDLFKIFDRDGNGRIDQNELKLVMNSVSAVKMTDQDVQTMINEADSNGDGVIDPSEFLKIMQKKKWS